MKEQLPILISLAAIGISIWTHLTSIWRDRESRHISHVVRRTETLTAMLGMRALLFQARLELLTASEMLAPAEAQRAARLGTELEEVDAIIGEKLRELNDTDLEHSAPSYRERVWLEKLHGDVQVLLRRCQNVSDNVCKLAEEVARLAKAGA